jgi:hypothetical protein
MHPDVVSAEQGRCGEHALEGDRSLHRRREPRHRLAVHGRRPGEDPAGEREMDSDHPMHHPFHIHGAGRFRWMAHCHIAEHHESGMMFSFDVDPAAGQTVGSA